MGLVKHIFTADRTASEMISHISIEAIQGVGLAGDRYAIESTDTDNESQLTLIEAEHIESFTAETKLTLPMEAPRRNLVTTGIALNELCGRKFRIGDVLIEGIELCEPCASLARRTYPEVLRFFVHKGGLRARILQGGKIQVGDSIHPEIEN